MDPSETILETERLVLRPVTMEDATAVFEIACHPDVWRYDFGSEPSIEQVREWVACKRLERRLRGIGMYVIVAKADNRVVGCCGLQFVIIPDLAGTDRRRPEIELFYGLARAEWGQGYATEAGRAMLAHGFGPLRFERIVASVDARNRRSQAVLSRLGMTWVPWPHHPEYLIGVAEHT